MADAQAQAIAEAILLDYAHCFARGWPLGPWMLSNARHRMGSYVRRAEREGMTAEQAALARQERDVCRNLARDVLELLPLTGIEERHTIERGWHLQCSRPSKAAETPIKHCIAMWLSIVVPRHGNRMVFANFDSKHAVGWWHHADGSIVPAVKHGGWSDHLLDALPAGEYRVEHNPLGFHCERYTT